MVNTGEIKFTKLSSDMKDNLVNFDCLNMNESFDNTTSKQLKRYQSHSKEMNNFLHNEALKEQGLGYNTTHILTVASDIVGFISLCSDSLRLDQDEKIMKDTSYTIIPALKIARLAVHKDYYSKGYGKLLLKFALVNSIKARSILGIKFITVDCYMHRLSYYIKNGFVKNVIQMENRQPHNPLSLRLDIDEFLDNTDIG